MIYDPKKYCFVQTDASRIGIGGVLKQKGEDKILHPVAYFSRKLLCHQLNYSVSELECLAIVEALDYLYGKKLTVITDHQALQWLGKTKKPRSRLINWSIKLSQYDFDIHYKPGHQNVEADALSRSPVSDHQYKSKHPKIINLPTKSEIQVEKIQFKKLPITNHTDYMKIVNLLTTSEMKREQALEIEKKIHTPKRMNADGISIRKNGLFHQKYVPKSLRKKLISDFHHDFGHIGTKKTLQMIAKSYYWKNMTDDVKTFIDGCETCQFNRRKRTQKLGSLSILEFAKDPFQIVSIDTIGGFEGYNSRQKYLHIAIDHFTRFIWVTTSRSQKAKDCMNLIEQVSKIGRPKKILSDHYPALCSKTFKNYLSSLNIQIIFVPPYTPKSNGMIERVNQTLVDRLRCKFFDEPTKSWASLVCDCVNGYNNSIHESTGFSPRFLLTGFSKFESSLDLIPNLDDARITAYNRSKESHEKNKNIYDKKHTACDFQVNDLVLIDSHSMGKLEPKRLGPYEMTEKLSSNSYRLNIPSDVRRNNLVNSEQMHLYVKPRPQTEPPP